MLAALLADHPQRHQIERSVVCLLEISRTCRDENDWRLIHGALADIREGLGAFHPHRRSRKVTVFGSARTGRQDPAYGLAEALAREAVLAGFEVMTGAGGGIMEAANRGAGSESSIGLNVDLPMEQHANRYVSGPDGRLLQFRYFFTRKLFFLRESDALVVLPGGFGTLDELFESLTLIQTGRTPPIPLVLLSPPGDRFWQDWFHEAQQQLVSRSLIAAEDHSLLHVAHSARDAIAQICRFYRVYHASHFSDDRLELLLHGALAGSMLAELNREFADLCEEGTISAGESCDDSGLLRPCLRLKPDKRRIGRLYQLINRLNELDLAPGGPLQPPGQREPERLQPDLAPSALRQPHTVPPTTRRLKTSKPSSDLAETAPLEAAPPQTPLPETGAPGPAPGPLPL